MAAFTRALPAVFTSTLYVERLLSLTATDCSWQTSAAQEPKQRGLFLESEQEGDCPPHATQGQTCIKIDFR